MNLELARFNMIEQQIRPWNVLDPAVLSLLAVVRREDFVPAAYRALAFVDCEIPLPEGQCMLAPKVEARVLQEPLCNGTSVCSRSAPAQASWPPCWRIAHARC